MFGENDVVDKNAILDKKTNLMEAAHNGTLYIDEVGAMPISAQVRLLKFLKDNIINKSNKQVTVNVRIITSNTKDLQQEILNGNFKQDLYYRLNVVPLNVPTLSERKEDIAELTRYFVSQLSKISGLKEREFSNETIAALQAYSWPGNIRQLRNVVENTLIMNPINSSGSADKIRPDMLPQEIISSGVKIVRPDNANVDMMSMPLREAREVFERQYLTAQMNRFNNNISKTSTFVGMERSALHRKLKTLNIHATNKTSNLDSEEDIGITKNEANIPIEA